MWKHILLGKKSNSLPHLPIVLWETIPINIKSNSNCFMGRPTGLTERSLLPGKPSEPIWNGTLPGISLTVSQDPQKFFLLGSSRKGFCTPSVFPSYEENEGNFWRPLHSCWWMKAGKSLCSCWSQISAVGLESGIHLCAGIKRDALISRGDKWN